MNILMHILKILIFIGLSGSVFSMPPQEPNNMMPPEQFKSLEKIIELTAEKQHKQIDNIHWSYSPKNEITANITVGDEINQIIFTNDELLKTQTGNTPSSVLKKIEAAISMMPRNDPPPFVKIK